jgi:hypothetical protein
VKVDKVAGKDLSTNDFTDTYKTKLDGIAAGANKTTVDSALSSTSTNPVQNKVVNEAISNLTSLVGDKSVSDQISTAIGGIESPVSSVNGQTGTVVLSASDVGAVTLEELPNLYIWKKYSGEPGTPVGTKISNAKIAYRFTSIPNSAYSSIDYADSITVTDGVVALVEPVTLQLTQSANDDQLSVIIGKYICCDESAVSTDVYHFIPSNATFTITDAEIKVSSAVNDFTGLMHGMIGYTAGKTGSTYPTKGTHTDGYWYEYHKQLGD